MNRPFIVIVLVPVLILLAAGCASDRSRWDTLYSRLSEEPETFDWSVLEGRRIVIDPGHGGHFKGAVGVDSLSEADANLGVALYLWGLLEEAGASVHLTRTTDRDWLPEGSTESADDLAGRIACANAWNPEVFLSIHHNSNIALDREHNMIEVYYMNDETGASLELSEEIHLHLARNLGIEDSTIKPGNYYVLRNSGAGASVLGEASYISNPEVEKRLMISTRQKLEAQAYFLGLLGYFSRGVPYIEQIPLKADTVMMPASVSFRISQGAGVPVDPASVRAFIDGSESEAVYDPGSGILTCPIPPDIPNGAHSARVSVRSIGGATAGSAPAKFTVGRSARFILPLPPRMDEPGRYTMTVRFLDRNGSEVADGTSVTIVSAVPGHGWKGKTREGVFTFQAGSGVAGSKFFVRSGDASDTLLFDTGISSMEFSILVLDARTGLPIDSPRLLLPDGSVMSGKNGRVSMPARLFAEDVILSARGYIPRPLPASKTEELALRPLVRLTPVLDGALSGKRIVIDPAGGGNEDYGRGPDKLRGATLNLELARRVRDILAAAGVHASLTRSGEETLSIHERIQAVNRSGADLALGLRYGSEMSAGKGRFVFTHYPSSGRGAAAAGALMRAVSPLPPCVESSKEESAELFLQQTGCPACEIHACISDFTEKLFRNPRWLEMEASSIVSGLAGFFSGRTGPCPSNSVIIKIDGEPAAGTAVSLDGVFTAVTDQDGTAVFPCAGHGTHYLLIDIPGLGPGGCLPFEISPGDTGLTEFDLP